jgi:beta-N-acetylhexosaminidase
VIGQKLTDHPFHLDGDELTWVRSQFARLSLDEKVAQLFVLLSVGNDPGEADRIKRLRPGGITRAFGPDPRAEIGWFRELRAACPVPPLISADLEGSRFSLPFGTAVLNPLGLAAVDDVSATRAVSEIMAREARAIGVRWSFTPVIDINHAFRSAIVATRSFGSDVDRIERHSLAEIKTFQRSGVAATVKHWPGEGYDDRDQHLVTTVNPLSVADWDTTFGRLYRSAINAGVMAVMSAHIAFPAFVRSVDSKAGVEAFRPASINRHLNVTLLRERLGFNGLIVSDATPMSGLGSWGRTADLIPEIIANGCDVVLFSTDPDGQMASVKRAVESGRITERRFNEAVMRVLGLKAALGLHRDEEISDEERIAALGTEASRDAADAITRRAPTLVKDTWRLLPIDPARHRRVLIITPGIVQPTSASPIPFALPDMLRAEGFAVTVYARGVPVGQGDYDLVLYLFGDETLLTRNRIFVDWLALGGDISSAMRRFWHEIPTAMISFGYPYLLYDAPRVPTYINAYSTLESVQRAVVDALLGRIEWNQNSPVDPFCGLEDARY